MALALQPASHEARHGTVAAAAAGGTPGWLGETAAAVKRQTYCCFTCHAGPRRMQLQPQTAISQHICRRLACPRPVKMLRQALCSTDHIHCDALCTTRVPRAVREPRSRRTSPGRIRAPTCGRRDDPGMTKRHLQGVCGSEIGRPALQPLHPLRIAQKLQMHRTECSGVATEARGCECTTPAEVSVWNFQPYVRLEVLGKDVGFFSPIEQRQNLKVASRLANAAALLGWLPATPAAVTASKAHALPTAVATRGSARSSAAAASSPLLCATSSGVKPPCSRGEGRGAGRRAPEPSLCAPHPILSQGVHPRGRE